MYRRVFKRNLRQSALEQIPGLFVASPPDIEIAEVTPRAGAGQGINRGTQVILRVVIVFSLAVKKTQVMVDPGLVARSQRTFANCRTCPLDEVDRSIGPVIRAREKAQIEIRIRAVAIKIP